MKKCVFLIIVLAFIASCASIAPTPYGTRVETQVTLSKGEYTIGEKVEAEMQMQTSGMGGINWNAFDYYEKALLGKAIAGTDYDFVLFPKFEIKGSTMKVTGYGAKINQI